MLPGCRSTKEPSDDKICLNPSALLMQSMVSCIEVLRWAIREESGSCLCRFRWQFLLDFFLTHWCMYVAFWCNGSGVGLATRKLRVRLPAVLLLGNNCGQVVYAHVPLSSSSINWCWLNGSAGITLAMYHGVRLLSNCGSAQLSGLRKGDEQLAYGLTDRHNIWHDDAC